MFSLQYGFGKKHYPIIWALFFAAIFLTACMDQTIVTVARSNSNSRINGETFIIWGRGNTLENGRASMPIQAIQANPEINIAGQGEMYHVGAGSYHSAWERATSQGTGPHLFTIQQEELVDWVIEEQLMPLDDCISMHEEFDDVIESLWPATEYQGKRWAVPYAVTVNVLFFNKHKLKELGWSSAEIRALPEQIRTGNFTLDDMVGVSQQAVEKGIVKPGFGYWHPPTKVRQALSGYVAFGGIFTDPESGKLLIMQAPLREWYSFQRRLVQSGITPDKFISSTQNNSFASNIWHDTVSHGHVLFWQWGVQNWGKWEQIWVDDLGGEAYLQELVGYALLPSGVRGNSGHAPMNVHLYALPSTKSAREYDQEKACLVLANTLKPKINTPYVSKTTYMGALQSQRQSSDYLAKPILAELANVIDHSYSFPNTSGFSTYANILVDYMIKAEFGELSPEQAAQDAVTALQDQLGSDQLIVQP